METEKPTAPTPAMLEALIPKVPGSIRCPEQPFHFFGVLMDKHTALETFGTDAWDSMLDMTHTILTGIGEANGGRKLEWVLSTIRAMKPRDAMEAMLFVQQVMLHGMMAQMLEISRQDNPRSDYFRKAVSAARELCKTYQGGMEAVGRYRSGGKQQIIVSHINVQDGAQAAFAVGGNVNEGGGGSDAKRSTP